MTGNNYSNDVYLTAGMIYVQVGFFKDYKLISGV